MSISSAFNAAMTGLTATARSSQVVSENLANALTPGYTRRSLELASTAGLPGVNTGSVLRLNDPGVINSRRITEAEHGAAKVEADFFARMSALVGTVDDESSLAAQFTNFESALVEAISRPDSTPRLHELSVMAGELVNSINKAADGLSDLRVQSETAIESQVIQVNEALKQIEKLNARIVVAQAGGMDAATMLDQRSQLVDQVNAIIPVNVVERDRGKIALFSEGGVALLDGKASEITFDARRDILPHMTQDNGLLSGLEVNGRAINTAVNGPLRGGTLAAHFEIRDVTSVAAQEDLDTMARDLIERFQDPVLDASIGFGDAGIFTDDGGFFDPADTVGVSNRLELNELVAMDGQAETWRFRDGLYAAAPGDPGNASLLRNYSDVLNENRLVSSQALGTVNAGVSEISASIMSRFARDSDSSARMLSFAAASFSEMSQAEQALGVDTDAELQNLMLIERAYAANAKVMTVVDELMETLLRI